MTTVAAFTCDSLFEKQPVVSIAEIEFTPTDDLSQNVLMLPQKEPQILPQSISSFPATLEALPTELHILIYSHLDDLDSVSFALASPAFYSIHRRLTNFRPVPLWIRRNGINPFEVAWAPLYGPLAFRGCGFCGYDFCQLWRHLEGWMEKGMGGEDVVEYCIIRENFGRKGDAAKGCFRSCPPRPGVCGKHGGKGTVILTWDEESESVVRNYVLPDGSIVPRVC